MFHYVLLCYRIYSNVGDNCTEESITERCNLSGNTPSLPTPN